MCRWLAYSGPPLSAIEQAIASDKPFIIDAIVQLAGNITAVIAGRETRPFRYHPEGVFATIGHRSAVGVAFGIRFSGFAAWSIWHAIYLAKMPSLTRKIQIAFEWGTGLFFPPDIVQLTTIQTERSQR